MRLARRDGEAMLEAMTRACQASPELHWLRALVVRDGRHEGGKVSVHGTGSISGNSLEGLRRPPPGHDLALRPLGRDTGRGKPREPAMDRGLFAHARARLLDGTL